MYFSGFTIKTMPLSYCMLARDITIYGNKQGWVSRTGVSDNDYFYHSSKGEVYLPTKNFGKKPVGTVFYDVKEEAIEVVREIHHDWKRLSHAQKLLAGSRVHSLMGQDLKTPSTMALFYSESGIHNKFQRRVCEYFGIEHFNLANYSLNEIRGITGAYDNTSN